MSRHTHWFLSSLPAAQDEKTRLIPTCFIAVPLSSCQDSLPAAQDEKTRLVPTCFIAVPVKMSRHAHWFLRCLPVAQDEKTRLIPTCFIAVPLSRCQDIPIGFKAVYLQLKMRRQNLYLLVSYEFPYQDVNSLAS